MKRIEEFLFKISGYQPRLREGQFVVNESILTKADEAYDNGDYETCTKIWLRYANLNNGVSLLRLAECYWRGFGVDSDVKKSFELLQKGTFLVGGAQNYFNLGVGYQMGGFVAQDYLKPYFFYVCASFYSNDDEIDLKKKSEERMVQVYKLLGDVDTEKADLILRAIDRGYQPAGMGIADEIIENL